LQAPPWPPFISCTCSRILFYPKTDHQIMRNKFTKEVKEMISLSAEETYRLRSNAISDRHLLLAMIAQPENPILKLLTAETGISPASLRTELEAALSPCTRPGPGHGPSHSMPLDRSAEKAVRNSIKEAKKTGSTSIDSIHFLLALAGDKKNNVAALLDRAGLTYQLLRSIATVVTPP
jgi:ATP-dependent Clp protease ATP-binding subunit ClpC